MKKSILLFGLILSSMTGYSQNTFPTAANTAVGIGTGSGAVSGTGGLRLKVTSGVSGTSGIQLTNVTSATTTTTGNSKALSVDASGNLILTPVVNTAVAATNIYNADGTLTTSRTITLNNNNLNFNSTTAGGNFFVNGITGKVGIGSLTPTARLDVSGGLPNGVTFATTDEMFDKSLVFNAGTLVNGSTKFRNIRFFDFPQSNFSGLPTTWFGIEDRNDFGRYRFIAETGGSTQMIMLNKSQQELMKIYEDGSDNVTMTFPKPNSYVCIGGTNASDGAELYKLSVKGKVRADEVKVYTAWADCVQ